MIWQNAKKKNSWPCKGNSDTCARMMECQLLFELVPNGEQKSAFYPNSALSVNSTMTWNKCSANVLPNATQNRDQGKGNGINVTTIIYHLK